MTALSGVALMVVKPWSSDIDFGDGEIVDFVEDYVEDLWAMAARALSVMVMMLWYGFSYDFVTQGVTNEDNLRMLTLWAVSITFMGSALRLRLRSCSLRSSWLQVRASSSRRCSARG